MLSDVNMPNMTGYELTQALRERGKPCRSSVSPPTPCAKKASAAGRWA
ncbi:hypothetical protein [Pseudomonas aeruginosa]|nr:hypothetical protein [Pseudomonas aeruginosa]MCT9627678.1 hypothetical protein [Pseudomonas aeruginosa]